jgi:hypothetical protein
MAKIWDIVQKCKHQGRTVFHTISENVCETNGEVKNKSGRGIMIRDVYFRDTPLLHMISEHVCSRDILTKVFEIIPLNHRVGQN